MVELVRFEWRIRAAGVDKGVSPRCGFLAGAPKGPGPGPCLVRDPASQAHSGAGVCQVAAVEGAVRRRRRLVHGAGQTGCPA